MTDGVRPPAEECIARYARTGYYLHALADGNAVNFLHGASAGASIFLVQAEILAALGSLAAAGHEPGLHQPDATARSRIAETWLHYFDGTS